MDLDAWLADDLASEETREAYQYFMKPEPRDIVGDLETDPETGIRSRLMKIGMVRGTKDDDKKTVRVYLDPLPHIRLDEGKPLQGWYKSKHEEPGVRNRPCFTDAVLTQPYGGFCSVGCAFAVYSGEWIDTPSGPKLVDAIRIGDIVWGRAPEGIVPTRVSDKIKKWSPDGIQITLSNGQRVRLNGEHPIWAPQKGGWIEARDLRPGDEVESFSDDLILREVREAYGYKRGEVLLGLQEDPMERILQRAPASTEETASRLRTMFGSDSESKSEVLQGLFSDRAIREDARQRAGREGTEVLLVRGTYLASEEDLRDVSRRTPSNSSSGQYERAFLEGAEEVRRMDAQVLGSFPFRADEMAYEGAAFSLRTEGRNARFSSFQLGVEGGYLSRRYDRSEAPHVVDVRPIPAGYVYDLETATENYYLKGSENPRSPALLVHNCYVNSGFKGYRGSGLISVPMNYGAQVRNSLKKMKTSAAGYFSSFTDPFLPLEDVYHNTQEGAQAFVDEKLPVFFLSRLKYPSWAYDILRKNPYSYAQKSINCANPEDWKRLSPGAASLAVHMEDIRELRKAGIYVSIQVNPIVPGVVNHDDVERIFEMLAEAGANHVIVKFVEAGYSWAPAMADRIKFRFGEERGRKFESLFTENIGGQRTIVEDYRLEGHRRYQKAATRLGMTYATCYEYRMERDATGRVTNKTGVSVGKEFLTADQCHGHRVPMFTRNHINEPFQEVQECPPTGCLSCADDNGGKSRCGSDLFGSAPALRLPDLKVGVYEEVPEKRKKSLPVVGNSGPSLPKSMSELFDFDE